MLSLAASALLRKARVLTAPAAVGVSITAALAWSLAMLTALSWSSGFDEADAGVPRTLFGELFVPLFLASLLAGTAAIAPIWASLMIRIRRHGARWSLATAAGALSAVALGQSAVTPTLGLAVSIGLLVIAQAMRRGPRAPRLSPPFQALLLSRRTRRKIVGLATLSGVLGILSVSFALTGSLWTSALDGTQAMNLGLSAGSLAAIPLAVASGIAVTRRRGAWLWAPTAALIAALVAASAGQFAGAGHPLQRPLILTSAAGLGIAVALVFSRVLPGGRAVRSIATGGIIVVMAAGAGLVAATLLPFVAPLAAIAVVVWAIRSSTSATPNSVGAPYPEAVWPLNG
jgi:hypothetical protein